MAIQGRCLCGEVRYQINGPLGDADHCHCSMCRRQHGAAFSTYADVAPGDFQWRQGEALVSTYEVPSGGGWCFCQRCGSTLAGTDAGQVTSITLGTVEGDPGVRPSSHIFVACKAPWHEISDELPQYAKRAEAD